MVVAANLLQRMLSDAEVTRKPRAHHRIHKRKEHTLFSEHWRLKRRSVAGSHTAKISAKNQREADDGSKMALMLVN
jgi:hypothetical protein